MRAIQITEYGPPSVLRVAEVPDPHAGPGEIRIAVRASGLSAGDVRIRSGELRDVVTLPYRTGFDAAGVVDEIGEGVTGVRVGDEVFGATATAARGANSDYAVLAAWALKPAAWSWAEAGGAAGSVETATRAFDRLGVGDGHTVLVQGAAGGVGTVAVQLAVARGATVIGTASEHNHDLIRALGAEPTTYGAGLADRVPSEVDAVLDCAGGALPELVAIAGDPARVVTIADLSAAAHGVHLSHAASGMPGADPLALHGLAIAAALADEGRLRVPVAAEFPLAEAAAAHELSESRRAGGKIVLAN
ncbi:NADP-dependent oxidoreductase [Amycolatopsis albispora]|uniref:NADPH:quinone reductase n=1 Tax=Amycolatopsis albispora TaxID=1804986 RepID=A0A344KZI6_9PSEU|nr:NADP-dependent oxidoreductase [Amycolatopsis albispora]AXB41210.1 NADPH:quinone reductase [Amycolatopsis albispora]